MIKSALNAISLASTLCEGWLANKAIKKQKANEPKATSTIRSTSSRLNTGFSTALPGATANGGGGGPCGDAGCCGVESSKSKVRLAKPLDTIYTN